MNKVVPICVLIVIVLLSLCALPGVKVSAQNADPAAMGPLLITSDEYFRTDKEFTPTEFSRPVELSGMVRYPVNWTGGPLPLIVFIHGTHDICSAGQTTSRNHWPCLAPTEEVIPNYKGFDYIARVLASNGYFVVSINTNGIIAQETTNKPRGTLARAELIQKHLQFLDALNTTTNDFQFGAKFFGKIDMKRIGLMGHSRGGESVVQYVANPLPANFGVKYDIDGVFVITPPDLPQPDPDNGDEKRLRINDVPFAVLLSYCDGDVLNLAGVHFYDDSRYNLPNDKAAKHMILTIGTNHNFYNRVWTPNQLPPEITYPDAKDDLKDTGDSFCKAGVTGSGRITDEQQRTIAIAYVSAFMRAYVGGEWQFLPLLTNQSPPPPSVGTNKVYVSFHPPDSPNARLDVNRLLEDNHLYTNALGGTVTSNMLLHYNLCGGLPLEPPNISRCLSMSLPLESEPHVVDSQKNSLDRGALRQLQIGWNKMSGALINEIPIANSNISLYQSLQFRASVNFDDKDMAGTPLSTPSLPLNFRVVLKDGTGATASVRVADFSPALFYPPGEERQTPKKVILNTVRLPLSAFARINLTNIRSLEFRFDQQPRGSLLITDIAFASAAPITLPVFSYNACLKDDTTGSELVFNTITGNYAFCCAGSPTITGVGKTLTRGNVVSLTQGANETDRRLTVTMDISTGQGTAALQLFTGGPVCTITDRTIANNTCSCAPAP